MNNNIKVAKQLIRIAKEMIKQASMSSIIKIDEHYDGYDNIYEIDNTNNVQCFIYFDRYNYACGFYMVFDKNRRTFTVNAINPELKEEDFRQGIPRMEFLKNLQVTNVLPSDLQDLQDELTQTIDFFLLMKIFKSYGYEYVGDKPVSNGSQKGLRFELSGGKGDFNAMIEEIKRKSNYPEKVIPGGQGAYRWAPEIKRKSVIILY